jgi:TolA-binding protein
VLAAGTTGCVTRAELLQRDQQLVRFMREQRRQVEAMQREVERLRGDVEGRTARAGGDHGSLEDRVAMLESRVYQTAPPAPLQPEAGVPVDVPPPSGDVDAATPPPPPPTPQTDLMANWGDDVRAEIQSAEAGSAAGRDAYVEIMKGLEGKDCGPAVAKLDAFAQSYRDSSLADNALYWAARCYVLMGDATPGRSTEFYNQAISKFYDVGTSYPKGEKTPAALLEQGDLFIRIGDAPDARIVFSRLIRDYPRSDEAGAARQKLVDLGG